MPIQATEIATAFAALSPIDTDIKILDLDAVKDKITTRSTPVLMPSFNFFTSPIITPDSFGSGSSAQYTIKYILTYRFFYKPVAAVPKRQQALPGFVGKTTAIIDNIIPQDTLLPSIDFKVVSVGAFDRVMDPSNVTDFWGTDIGIQVTEFING